MEMSKETMQTYLQMCMDDMTEEGKAALGLFMKHLSGSSQSDQDYLQENFPDVAPEAVLQILREYAEYKLQQK